MKYKETVSGYDLEFNSRGIFNFKTILAIVMKNGRQTISRCLDSVFNQQGIDKLGVLLIDDNSNDNWASTVQRQLRHPALVIHRCNVGKISTIRNRAIYLVKAVFPEYQWLGRLDADDCLDNSYAIADTLRPVLERASKAKWILAGNSLLEDGRILKRKNFPSDRLMTKEGLLEATLGMSQCIPEAELPSCNLWLHRGMNVTYPAVPSAEDHWLVTFLLARHSGSGLIRPKTLYACYTLGGQATSNAKKLKHYRSSRKLLNDSVKYWLDTSDLNEKEAILGWGEEAVVYRRGNRIHKNFIIDEITQTHVSWIKKHLNGPHFPRAEWKLNGPFWNAIYPFQKVRPPENVSLRAIQNFIHYCLDYNMICLDIAHYNLGLVDGELFVFDIGRDIQPFKITYFRDMCARMYLSLLRGYSDEELKERTLSFRDNEEELKKICGFEAFYKDVMCSWIESREFGKTIEPAQEHSLKYYNEVTLLIKSCAMDASLIEEQINHILTQLCCTHKYAKVLLLIDSRKQGFLRAHNLGDYEKVVKVGRKLHKEGKIDEILIAPVPEQPEYVTDLYCRWFGVKSKKTHTEMGVPVFSQLWAFEQVDTRYVLQLDIDVLIGRRNFEHDYLQDMLTAIQGEKVFCVGFNIPHASDSQLMPYHAPQGGYKPEVRFGLLDLQRLITQRPFPNSVSNGFLKTTWYQSVHKYQQIHGWKSLRGGNPNSYYIHPPNRSKMDQRFITKVMDLIEQDQIPRSQYRQWDLIGNSEKWTYPSRNEDIIVLIMGRNTKRKKIYRCLDSLFSQTSITGEHSL